MSSQFTFIFRVEEACTSLTRLLGILFGTPYAGRWYSHWTEKIAHARHSEELVDYAVLASVTDQID